MASSANVEILHEVTTDDSKIGNEWVLCLQWCKYNYDDGTHSFGYRFIWRRENGNLQAARGQARIPRFEDINLLMAKAKYEGWGDLSDKKIKVDNR